MTDEIWNNCYDGQWKGLIVPEAFSHPAKFSCGLIRKIYEHAHFQGWLGHGDTVLDPFGGVALGAMEAFFRGYNWIGVELESRFVDLGNQNIELWRRLIPSKNPHFIKLIQGDSQSLKEVIRKADIVISSPPFYNQVQAQDPKYQSMGINHGPRHSDYGHTPGQLANMKEGSFDAVISSPPYAKSLESKDIDFIYKCGLNPTKGHGSSKEYLDRAIKNRDKRYGNSNGQLDSMKEGLFDCVVSSPPYEASLSSNGTGIIDERRLKNSNDIQKVKYSMKSDNLGNTSGNTFWSASRIILEQCYELLRPSGHAIFVTKNYIKNKRIVPFSERWLALCESVGFKLVCRHKAMLVKNHGKQRTLGGEVEELKTERKSFFRRLAESKGSPRIDWEDILCFEKL